MVEAVSTAVTFSCKADHLNVASQGILTPFQEHLFIHYTPSDPQIRCALAGVLWQPSSLLYLGVSSTM